MIKLLRSVLKEKAGWSEVVRAGAITGLSQMKTSEAALDLILEYTALGVPQALANQTPDRRVRRIAEEAVQTVQKAIEADKAVKKLQQELDQLKKDNQELRSCLESLEAKSK